MKTDEFAFMNQQLAGMLRQGIPLEGALQRLACNMDKGPLRREIQALGDDLANGIALNRALEARNLPSFYVVMIKAGIKSSNLPEILTMLGDYYVRVNAVGIRLKGLLLYPAIVLAFAGAVSVFAAYSLDRFLREFANSAEFPFNADNVSDALLAIWTPAYLIVGAFVLTIIVAALPALRRHLRWRLPAFHEASIARISSAIAIMLKGGCTLAESVEVASGLETNGPARRELEIWKLRLSEGCSGFPGLADENSVFPPLYAWLVEGAGEDLPTGFDRAGRFYADRAHRRCDLLLSSVLPISIVGLGCMIIAQFAPLAHYLKQAMSALSG